MSPLTASGPDIVGREAEVQALQRFLDQLPDGLASLLLMGDAGIGKTVLLQAAMSSAEEHGYRVLSCRPAEAEAHLSFVGLADLLVDAIDDELRSVLPEPQRHALDVVLLLQSPGKHRSTSERSRPPSCQRSARSHGADLSSSPSMTFSGSMPRQPPRSRLRFGGCTIERG
jgi:hypothetical protein